MTETIDRNEVAKQAFERKEWHTFCLTYIQDGEMRETCYRCKELKEAVDWFYSMLGGIAQPLQVFEANVIEALEDLDR